MSIHVCLCAHESRCPQSQRCRISGVAVIVTGLVDAGSQTVLREQCTLFTAEPLSTPPQIPRSYQCPDADILGQWFSTVLTLRPFNPVAHAVVTQP